MLRLSLSESAGLLALGRLRQFVICLICLSLLRIHLVLIGLGNTALHVTNRNRIRLGNLEVLLVAVLLFLLVFDPRTVQEFQPVEE